MALITTKILLIDDDSDDRLLIKDMLSESKRARFVVEEAETGEAGLESLRTNRYDAVFLDFRLPDKDGSTVLKEIIDLRFNVPVIIITNLNDLAIQNEALEAGAVDFLEKGKINTDILERTIIYAIGLQEKKNGNAPGVGVLMEQLVNLTRDGTKAQTKMTQETREFRRELGEGLQKVSELLLAQGADNTNTHKVILEKIEEKNTPKAKWVFDWIALHPVVAFAMLMSAIALIVILAILVVLLFEHASAEKIKAMKDIVGFLLMDHSAMVQRWTA